MLNDKGRYLVNGAKEEDEHRRDHASHDYSDHHQKLGEILPHPSSRLLDPSPVVVCAIINQAKMETIVFGADLPGDKRRYSGYLRRYSSHPWHNVYFSALESRAFARDHGWVRGCSLYLVRQQLDVLY